MFTLTLSDEDAQILSTTLENAVEWLEASIKPDEDMEAQVQRVLEEITAGAGAPVTMLAQRWSSLAHILVQLYDTYGWPPAFNEERRSTTRELVALCLEDDRRDWRKGG